ncbi:hypothetical protein OA408_02680 [Acidimicrobiaceae bacterium]|nr:hypothetical protein [Acidimicrobiaceae bacterium]
MNNYQNTIRVTLFIFLLLQISLYFMGYLRPSIIYDYLDYWPLTIFPISLVVIFRNSKFKEVLTNFVNILLIIIVTIFSIAHLFDSKFLSTYQNESFYKNSNLSDSFQYKLLVDIDGKLNFSSSNGFGYSVDIIDRPGKVGYPESIETLVGNPRAVIFREIETSNLFKVEGWNIRLGEKNLWELDIFSVDSKIYFDNLNLLPSKVSGTGEIFLGDNLKMENLIISGNYEITVSDKLSILIIGQAETPEDWLEATVGILNLPEETYTLVIEIIDGSQVLFKDG